MPGRVARRAALGNCSGPPRLAPVRLEQRGSGGRVAAGSGQLARPSLRQDGLFVAIHLQKRSCTWLSAPPGLDSASGAPPAEHRFRPGVSGDTKRKMGELWAAKCSSVLWATAESVVTWRVRLRGGRARDIRDGFAGQGMPFFGKLGVDLEAATPTIRPLEMAVSQRVAFRRGRRCGNREAGRTELARDQSDGGRQFREFFVASDSRDNSLVSAGADGFGRRVGR